jgi:endonuclease YncB( thermonuclease family)
MHAVCTKVINADTLLVHKNEKQYIVRLAYIITPEFKQKFGPEAQQFVESIALNQQLRITVIKRTENVLTAEVFAPKKRDTLNRELARKGLAWPLLEKNKKHPYDLSFSFAKKRSLGVWSAPELKPPAQKGKSNAASDALPAAKGGYAQDRSPALSQGAQGGGNVMMQQRQRMEAISGTRAAQQEAVQP